jgi:site-specific DNA recombinase
MRSEVEPDRDPRLILYARVSVDAHGNEVSTDQQLTELRAVADEKGYAVVAEFAERGFSASRFATRARKMFAQANAMLAAGEADGILFWDMDRLLRTPRQLEDLIDLVDRGERSGQSLVIESVVSGTLDLRSPSGRAHARSDAIAAAKESDLISIRVKRSRRAERKAGMPNPGPAYGWASRTLPDPEQAAVVKEMFERFTSGDSLAGIARDLNRRHVPTRRQGRPVCRDGDRLVGDNGTGWRPDTVADVLSTAKNYGLVRHPDGTMSEGAFEGILAPADHARFTAVLRARGARNRGWPRRTSLTAGMVYCANCGLPMTRENSVGGGGKKRSYLICKPVPGREHACRRNRIPADVVEAAVRDALCSWMDNLDLSELLVDDSDAVTLQAEIERLDEMMADLRRRAVLVPGDPERISITTADELLEAAREQRDEVVKRFDAVASKRHTVLAQFASQGGALARAWDAPETTDAWRRRVLKAFLDELGLRIEVQPGSNHNKASRAAAGGRLRLVHV